MKVDNFSLNDPKNKYSLKIKVKETSEKLKIMIEILKLDTDNKTLVNKVDFFMDVSEFDFLSYEYFHRKICVYEDKKGFSGKTRTINITRTSELDYSHLELKISNGKAPARENNFTPIGNNNLTYIFHLNYPQAIKMFKYIERCINAYYFKYAF